MEYVGNNVTSKLLLNQQLLFSVPSQVSGAKLSESIQNIRDLGLFESVVSELEAVESGFRLKVTIDEKFYVIPLPRLGLNSDGETSYGASLEWDNIAGLNQRIKLVWERRQLQDESLGEREIFRFNYEYPRIAGSLWNGGFFTDNSRVPVEETPEEGGRNYISKTHRHGVSLGRQLSARGQTKGWFIDSSLFYLQDDNEPRAQVPELEGGSTWAVSFGGRYEDRHLYTYTEEGVQFNVGLEISLPVANPDFSYNRFIASWRYVAPGFKKTQHHSVIYRAGLGVFNGGIPEQVGFTNSSSNLRGLKKGEVEGNTLVYGSLEYLLPVSTKYPSWRYGMFLDMAVFADDYTNICLCETQYSVGAVLVWRPRKLVKVELRGEYGYNINNSSSRPGGGLDRF